MSDKSPLVWLHRLFAYLIIIILLLLVSYCQCCGPGRSGGRRRSPRKLTPLVFKQHVPNVAENTLGASGLTEGRISREDPRFSDLVPNYNVDILFSDEEGTGADRLMTERCKEKLNTLAVSVMNQWPGVRLRVVEAWDEGSHHVPNSLHYEGRAVDVATSDKDLTKHGMLARLAVQAGFDWVYYESRSRIHCSVKSESTSRKRLGGCFPGKAGVQTPSGRVNLENLQEGDVVKVLRSDGKITFSPILMFLHKDHSVQRQFLSFVTSSGASINLTSSHLIFVLRKDKASISPTIKDAYNFGETLFAGQVTIGSYLIVTHNDSIYLEKVVDMNSLRGEGVFAPLTAEGNIIVDNVVASCYAVIDSHRLAHWAFLPFRLYIKFKEIIVALQKFIELNSSGPPYSVKSFQPMHASVKENRNNLLNNTKYASSHYLRQKKSIISKPEIIHWYPRMLYAVAAWILPSHMIDM